LDWIVLRCSGKSTLRLAHALDSHHVKTWTPAAIIRKRRPRSTLINEQRVPLMPSFVFAGSQHVETLLAWSHRPPDDCPQFSLFRFDRRIPLIADLSMSGLRREEERQNLITRKAKARRFETGETVAPTDGAWQGMVGQVVKAKGREYLVCFGSNMTVTIADWLLEAKAAA